MLKSWTVGGFKSFGDPMTLPLAPITLFAGANSSGKSSLLQSILLLKQTLQYGAANRPLSLNGPLLKLGTLSDVIHTKLTSAHLSISFDFDVSGEALERQTRGAVWLPFLRRQTRSELGPISSIRGDFVWSYRGTQQIEAPTTFDKLHAAITSGRLVVEHQSPTGDEPIQFHADYSSRAPTLDLRDTVEWCDIALDFRSEAELSEGRPDATIKAAFANQFLPGSVQIEYDIAKQHAHEVAGLLCGRRMVLGSIVDRENLPRSVVSVINDWLVAHDDSPLDEHPDGVPLATARERLGKFTYRYVVTLASRPEPSTAYESDIQALYQAIVDAMVAESGPHHDIDFVSPKNLEAASEYLRSFFRWGIRYLGPLRNEPRPVYELAALENTTDVGYRGEHTAAVLYGNRHTAVQYVPPSAFDRGAPLKLKTATLYAAVTEWLDYMGVATEVHVTDAGVFGNQLQVKPEGSDRSYDLTNVGVGVSQVLPILVSALLAPKSSLLIFEQPELHLHPRVQARLADFFLALAVAKRQCILESHSEYMVERFRLRIAESEDSTLQSMIALYFTERRDGVTSCRPVEVNRYGAISDWPKDFFDQSQREATDILQAASKKRKQERDADAQ